MTNARGEPLVQVNVKGAIRSAKCIKVCPYENECFEKFTCISCALLPDRRSFRNLVERRIERVAGQMLQLNYEYDFHDTLVDRCKYIRDELEQQKLKSYTLSRSLKRSKKKDILGKLNEDQSNADLVTVLKTLVKAKSDGTLTNDDTIWQYIKSTMSNWYKSPRGVRYPTAIFEMLQAVQIKGGSAVAGLVSRCLKLGSTSSTRPYVRKHLMQFDLGIHKGNFSSIAALYRKFSYQ